MQQEVGGTDPGRGPAADPSPSSAPRRPEELDALLLGGPRTLSARDLARRTGLAAGIEVGRRHLRVALGDVTAEGRAIAESLISRA